MALSRLFVLVVFSSMIYHVCHMRLPYSLIPEWEGKPRIETMAIRVATPVITKHIVHSGVDEETAKRRQAAFIASCALIACLIMYAGVSWGSAALLAYAVLWCQIFTCHPVAHPTDGTVLITGAILAACFARKWLWAMVVLIPAFMMVKEQAVFHFLFLFWMINWKTEQWQALVFCLIFVAVVKIKLWAMTGIFDTRCPTVPGYPLSMFETNIAFLKQTGGITGPHHVKYHHGGPLGYYIFMGGGLVLRSMFTKQWAPVTILVVAVVASSLYSGHMLEYRIWNDFLPILSAVVIPRGTHEPIFSNET